MQKQKGFTIIELIVVIAIIAVLAAIVLVNVTSYINKGKDAAARGNMASLLTNSTVWFDANSTYVGFAASSGYTTISSALTASGMGYTAPVTNVSGTTAWCASIVLKTGSVYCVDASGNKKEGGSACPVAAVCP
jgi:type IV pilus assembly protein PilA